MQHQIRRAFIVALAGMALVLLLQPALVRAQPQDVPPSHEAQLLAAMRLWGDIRFFDPQAANGSVDWDTAFINAEPAILAANSKQSYSAAIAALLAPLHDPATYVNADVLPAPGHLTVSWIGSVARSRLRTTPRATRSKRRRKASSPSRQRAATCWWIFAVSARRTQTTPRRSDICSLPTRLRSRSS